MKPTTTRIRAPSPWLVILLWQFLCTTTTGVSATPIPSPNSTKRQAWTGMYAEELSAQGCKPVIFIYARETIAPGNMGVTVGPALSNGLKSYFGAQNVATQGVNYQGLIETNYNWGGGALDGIYLMQQLLTTAATYCPQSKIVAAGYSQGAAITHRAIESLPLIIKARIAGVVTFGDTQTLQDGLRIREFPLEKTLIICNTGDVICAGYMWVVPVHFYYLQRVPEGLAFLIARILSPT
ncbi:putative cutinase 1 [Podospora australis]|uniref:cutinase n=1 Tax=Podospora australis TaxID=1536484 RepID=A0AAN6WN12_9PEZI|nr:putative cutinase 1 [Podospora australis]